MAFVIDGSGWDFSGWDSDRISLALDRFLERADIARERGETIWLGDDLQSRHVLNTLDIWSLWSPESPFDLSREILQELSALLGSAPRYADENEWPPGFEDDITISVAGGPAVENADVAWAHHWVRARRAVGCMALEVSKVADTSSSLGSVALHWITSEHSHRGFWRSAIEVQGDTERSLIALAPHAFPDLHFHEGVWHGLGALAGGYSSLRQVIRGYLAVLDDEGEWVFTHPPPALLRRDSVAPQVGVQPSNQVVERRFQGLGLEIAPENPDVRADRRCREAREIRIGTRTLYCEWHGKFEPHRNRVHIHPPVPESAGKVVVAIFHEHLPLP